MDSWINNSSFINMTLTNCPWVVITEDIIRSALFRKIIWWHTWWRSELQIPPGQGCSKTASSPPVLWSTLMDNWISNSSFIKRTQTNCPWVVITEYTIRSAPFRLILWWQLMAKLTPEPSRSSLYLDSLSSSSSWYT